MRSWLFFIGTILVFIACKKNESGCAPVSPDSESAAMAAFCSDYGIDYTIDSNGIYYEIVDQGSGETATIDSLITVTYTASLLTGDIIDDRSDSALTRPLKDFIEGWRLAIPYIQEGGHIKMVVPSSLAYGCTGTQGLIPANSPLYFDVVLINVSR